MKNVRLFYTKSSRMRFISHLDMTRFMTRIIRRANIPVWYTEGFNPHLYMTFALPLSLGFNSDYEVIDIRLTDDDFPIDSLCERLNAVCPPYIRFFDAAEPIKKAADVKSAEFRIDFDDGGECRDSLLQFLSRDEIPVAKKTKKGGIKEFNAAQKIIKSNVRIIDGNTALDLILPAGSEDNLNPELLLGAFFEEGKNYFCYVITRTAILDTEGKFFK